MNIYLPIAEMSVNIWLVMGLGGVAGLLSGMFGIGGGFLLTPLLMFLGVPPTVAVASSGNQIIASSVSGFLVHWKRNNVDFRMGTLLLLGGIVGSSLGIWLFSFLKSLGQIDLVISLSYVLFLTLIGGMMSFESFVSFRQKKKVQEVVAAPDAIESLGAMDEPEAAEEPSAKAWRERLPLQMDFPRSGLRMSALFPPMLSLFIGVLVSIMGIGGGFFMIPAMMYILKMPAQVVVGTSLFQVIFVMSNVTFLHALNTQSVDVVLAILLLIGSVVSAQVGIRLATKLPTEMLRALLALIVLGVAVKLALALLTTPSDLYSMVLEVIR